MLAIENLKLNSPRSPVLRGVSLAADAGEALAVVGASGSGKTTLALSVLGHLRPGIALSGGRVRVAGRDTLPVPHPELRGRTVAYLGQDAGTTLNPYRRLWSTLDTALGTRDRRRAEALLRRVGLPASLARRWPAELSGGQQQRAALAAALARSPRLLVLDEPTSALDPAAKEEVRTELARVREAGVGLLWITHDLSSVDGLVDRVVVLEDGRIVEDAPADRVLTSPASRPAAALLAATSPASPRPRGQVLGTPPVLRVEGLTATLGTRRVLENIALTVQPGRCLAVTGASGSGKTTLARCIAGLHPSAGGAVLLDGRPLPRRAHRRPVADRAAIQLVPQSPAETLHPLQTVRDALMRPLRVLRGMRDPHQIDEEIERLLSLVHLPSGYARRTPGRLSGGQRQRVAIARALAAGPRVLLCDEMTSALDSVTQASVLDLVRGLCEEQSLGALLITHDPKVVHRVADDVTVLEDGRLRRRDVMPAGRTI
ncbi:ATP-binding cassette domain-containing protein [Streptomyces sp. ISID311]|uniref:ABC transporter ATP-binding protein n=1 Tax=Streptomyces sp. ISID311 TaxID=2601673 RepID=UPI0011BD34E2|nr:ATP-binding cassette domain-containing protein [Streptomyces sp. ISID311]TXC99834.1 ABC transporter ATP-binding protein [Streptomyces sp. ISID311]